MDLIEFEKNVVILGFGSIAKATIPLISNHLKIETGRLKIITKDISDTEIKLAKKFNAKLINENLNKKNYKELLDKFVSEGDLIVNLTAGVNSIDLMRYASNRKILYLDTCIEMWPDEVNANSKTHDDRELLLNLKDELKLNKTTSLSSIGANPGIVSLLSKRLMLLMAKDIGAKTTVIKSSSSWADLAQQLTIRVIHINERDTQYTNEIVGSNDFISTWSVEAMAIECIEPSEMAIGSHEKKIPSGASLSDPNNKRDIFFDRSGKDVRISTWLPLTGEQYGMVLNHNEPLSLAQLLTKDNGNECFSPTVCFVYHPCEQAMTSLKNLTEDNYYNLNAKLSLHNIIDGYDELGVYIMTEKHGSFWLGSALDIHTARKLNIDSSATSLQVAGGVIAGMCWVVTSKDKGIVEPEDIINHDFLLDIAERYWGGYKFYKSNWTPGGNTPDSTLQFESFIYKE